MWAQRVLPSSHHAAITKTKTKTSSSHATSTVAPSVALVAPVASFSQKLRSIDVYRDTVATVVLILYQAALSALFAFAATFVFSRGLLVSGQSAYAQSSAVFIAGVTGMSSVFHLVVVFAAFSSLLARYRWRQRPEHVPPPWFWRWRLLRRSARHTVVAVAAIHAFAYAVSLAPQALHPFQLHFYGAVAIANYNTAVLDVCTRELYETEAVPGGARRLSTTTTTMSSTLTGLRALDHQQTSFWRRVGRAYVRNISILLALSAAAAYIQVASHLTIDDDWQLVAFSLGSLAFRMLILKASQRVTLRHGRIHERTIYLSTVVPTVMIDTQVRFLQLRVQDRVSIKGLLAVMAVEPLLRLARCVLVARRLRRLRQRRALATSRSASAVLAQQIDRVLRFAAAEVHADMCSEYIAMACSASIYFFFHRHPKFIWRANSGTKDTQQQQQQQQQYTRVSVFLLQVALEILIDSVCSVWELLLDIPLRVAASVKSHSTILFVGCAVANISVCCSLYAAH